MNDKNPNWLARHPVITYLLIANGFTWAVAPLALSEASPLPAGVRDVLSFLIKFGPSLAGVVTMALVGGRAGLTRLFGALFRWRVHPAWYALVLAGPPILLLAAVYIWGALGDGVPPAEWAMAYVFVYWLAVRVLIGGGLGEELGWRGFMLPYLQNRWGPIRASLVIGFFWGLWHVPAFLFEGTGKSGGPAQIVLFTVFCMVLSLIFTWVYNGSGGSLLIVVLLHGCINGTDRTMDTIFPGQQADLVWGVMLLGIAIVLTVATRLGQPPASTRVCETAESG